MTPIYPSGRRSGFVVALIFVMGAVCLGVARAADAAVTRDFDLPVAAASETLRQFVVQSGVDVVFSTEATARRQTNAVKGIFSPQEALTRLLTGTGLVAERNPRTGAFTVLTAPPAPAESSKNASPAAPKKSPEPKSSRSDPLAPTPTVKKTTPFTLVASLLTVGAATANAQTAPGDPRPSGAEAVVLSPFVVNTEKDTGYQSSDTLAGSRLSTPIKDIAASISVYNKDFLNDIGATNANDLLIYATGMEAGGPGGNFSNAAGSNIVETAVVGDSVRNAPQSASRSRGLSGPTFSRGFFATDISVDSYNTASVTVNRGPNAILFGVASPAGVVDTTLLRADLVRNISKFEFRYGNNDALRATFDLNRVLIPKKLAFRLASVADDEKYNQRPAFENKRRLYGTLTFQPYRSTVLRGDFETGNTKANRPFSVLPFNSISPQWYAAGRQAFDWTFYDDPARNPLAASQSSSGNVPGNALGTPAVPFRGFLVGQQGFFGPPVFQIANAGAGGGQISTGFYSGARTTNTTGAGSLAINSIRNQLFDPVFNKDSTNDAQQFYETRNVSEIPGDYYSDRRVPAGIKTQGFTDFSAFDWKNQQIDETGRQNDTFHSISLSLEQRAWADRIGVEAAYYREHYETRNRNNFFSSQGNANHLRVDVNAFLPDGRPNPNLGRPYADFSQQIFNQDVRNREALRGTAYLKYDFKDLSPTWGKWLGRHTATILGERVKKDALRIQSKFTLFGTQINDVSANPYDFNRLVHALAYIGPSIIGNNNPLKLQAIKMPNIENNTPVSLNVFDAPAGSPDQAKVTALPYSFRQTFRNGFYNRDIIESKAASAMSYWFDDLLVTTVGWRRDEDRFFQDVPATGTSAAGLANVDLINASFDNFILPERPPIAAAREVKTYGAVLRWPQKLIPLPRSLDFSVFYNSSGNFTPNTAGTDAFGVLLPSAKGETKEYGFNFSALNNRFNVRLSHFETKVIDADAGRNGALSQIVNNVINQTISNWTTEVNRAGNPSREGDIATLLSFLPADYATLYKFTVTGSATAGNLSRTITSLPGYRDVQDYVAKGTEADIVFNPTRSWRMLLNVSKNEVTQSRIAPNTITLFNRLQPAITLLGSRPKSVPAATYVYPIDPATGAANLNALDGSQTLAQYWTQNVVVPLANLVATEGVTNPEIRKYRANFVTNYTFARDSFLRGFGIGGGVRWEDKVAIGYPVKYTTPGEYYPLTATPASLAGSLITSGPVFIDRAHPYYAPAQTNVDGFMSYTRKIWNNRVDWKVQLNVRNLIKGDDLIPITAQPDGSPASMRLGVERRWYVTNSFSF